MWCLGLVALCNVDLVPWPGIEPLSPALAGRFLTTGSPTEVQVDILVLSPSFILDLNSIPPFPPFFFNHRDWKQTCWFIFLKRECLGLQQLESSVRSLDRAGQVCLGTPGSVELSTPTSHERAPFSLWSASTPLLFGYPGLNSWMWFSILSLSHTQPLFLLPCFIGLILCPLFLLIALFPFLTLPGCFLGSMESRASVLPPAMPLPCPHSPLF